MDEINSNPKNHISDMGVLDLRYATTAEDLKDIRKISDIGTILISEKLMGGLGHIEMHDIGAIVPVPVGDNIHTFLGQTLLTGESLKSGDPNSTLLLVGQTFITTPVTEVGYKDLRVVGQLFAIRGSENAIMPKMTSINGQNFFIPEKCRHFTGETNVSQEFLQELPEPTALFVMGNMRFEPDVRKETIREKITEIMLMGSITGSRSVIPLLEVLTLHKMGEIRAIDALG